MLSLAEQALLKGFKRALTGRFGERLVDLRLFGSRARAEGTEESDLDVLVVVRGLTRAERAVILDLALALELDAGLVLSPLVRDLDAKLGVALAEELARDGVSL